MLQAVMFPGQGSQEIGMGKDLFSLFPEMIEEANDVFGFDIEKLCQDSTIDFLSRTDNAQAAIFTVNAMHYRAAFESGVEPSVVLGHSIGQFNALVAAGVISYADGLFLVRQRGRLMAKQNGGAMAAVMKITADELSGLLESEHSVGSEIDIANYNSLFQTVIAGTESAIEGITKYLHKSDALVVKLNTKGAFHSRHMVDAKEQFSLDLQKVNFLSPKIKLICNVTGLEIKSPADSMARHLISPVRWFQSIYHVLHHANKIDDKANFNECGHGKTLTNILRYNMKEYSKLLVDA